MNTHLIVDFHAVIFGRGIPAGECEVAGVEESKRESSRASPLSYGRQRVIRATRSNSCRITCLLIMLDMLTAFKLTSLLFCSYLLRFGWFGSGTLNKIIYICRQH